MRGIALIEEAPQHRFDGIERPQSVVKHLFRWEQILILFVFIQVIFVAMVYGPIAGFLVELFPTRIRYTSMSLPYHIGNGIFGGLTPYIATSLYVASQTPANPQGDPFAGLYYPIVVAAICFLIGMIFLSNKRKADVMH